MTDSNISVSSSRAGRSAEIEKLIWEMVDALGTIDGVAMNDWGEGDPEFVAARAALLEYLADRTLNGQELDDLDSAIADSRTLVVDEEAHGRPNAEQAAYINRIDALREKLADWSSPTTEEPK